jgi:uncharacterized oxidoreductase
MPRFYPDKLKQLGYGMFEAVGCSPQDARIVADHLIESSLAGHDSHGVIRLYEYVAHIKRGVWDPTGAPVVVSERPCTATIDGGGAMGQVGASYAMRIAIEKAREQGTATVTLRNCCHVGRVGAYPLMAASEGMVGIAFVNAGRMGRQIAPYGGLDGRLATNPIAFSAPRRDAEPILVDMATSVVAEGKIRVTRNRQEPAPEGWIIDHQGRPTSDPEDYLERGGAILPLGGVAAHKGYCLGILVDLLGGALSGEGVSSGGTESMKSNGVLFTVYNIPHFTDLDTYYEEVETLVRHVHSSRIDPAIGEIQLPGNPEFRAAEERCKNGIELDPTTWSRVCASAEALGVDWASDCPPRSE